MSLLREIQHLGVLRKSMGVLETQRGPALVCINSAIAVYMTVHNYVLY